MEKLTFEEFIGRIVELIYWLLILGLLIALPFIFFVYPYYPFAKPIFPLLADPFLLMKTDFFRISVFPGFTWATLVAAAVIWWERKLMAKIQIRVGPQYAGRFEGILQPIADIVKLLFKEVLIPRRADRLFFLAAPVVALAVGAAPLAVIPISETWFIANIEVGLLVVFAAISFFPLIILMAAWASNSKYPFIGGLRALHQMIAYEIPMILAAVGTVLLSNSLNLMSMVRAQSGLWFILLQPLGALVFFCCMLAEVERIPFDLPEAEPELVMGWMTEYSSTPFALIQLGGYVKFYALSALFTALFLGGWHGPPPIPPEVWFILKTFIVMTVGIIIRGTHPRVRIDLLLRMGWTGLLVLALINIFITLLILQLGVIV